MEIPDNVKRINANVFSGMPIEKIAIPNTVTEIQSDSFRNCSLLTEVFISDGVLSIGDNAFYECRNLKRIKLPSGLKSIGNHAFYKCINLQSILFPATLTSIGNHAFFQCMSIESLEIPDSVIIIGEKAFSSCSSLIPEKTIVPFYTQEAIPIFQSMNFKEKGYCAGKLNLNWLLSKAKCTRCERVQ